MLARTNLAHLFSAPIPPRPPLALNNLLLYLHCVLDQHRTW
jgi:hypothetical protein